MTSKNMISDNQLDFPIQRTKPSNHNDDDQLYRNVIMKYTGYLNEVAAGTRELTEELKQDIREINAICLRSNYPPIDIIFQ